MTPTPPACDPGGRPARLTELRREVGVSAVLAAAGLGWILHTGEPIDPARAWPVYLSLGGLALFIVGATLVQPPGSEWLVMVGGAVVVAGMVLLYQTELGRWDSWAYLWAAVVPGGAGLGLMGYRPRRRDAFGTGVRVALTGVVLAALLGALFETVLHLGAFDLRGGWRFVFPGGLFVVAGSFLYVVLPRLARTTPRTPAPTGGDRPRQTAAAGRTPGG